MKVFISWSGERSHAVAKLLNEWIPCVIQAAKPWISSEDIEKGFIWFDDITNTLKETNIGIICLTPENKDKPWILFESGALLSGLTKPRVCTFLIDLTPTDIVPPLSQFNHTIHLKTDILKLFKSLNNRLEEEHKLDEKILKKAFNTYWPDFDKKYREILKIKPEEQVEVEPRSEKSMMSEVLTTVRSLEQRLGVEEDPHVLLCKYDEAINRGMKLFKKGKDKNDVYEFLIQKLSPRMASKALKIAYSETKEHVNMMKFNKLMLEEAHKKEFEQGEFKV